MFENKHTNAPISKQRRYVDRFVAKAQVAEARKASAADKRARKAEKRVRDAQACEIGQMKAREALDAGAPRGMWCAGVYSAVTDGAVL